MVDKTDKLENTKPDPLWEKNREIESLRQTIAGLEGRVSDLLGKLEAWDKTLELRDDELALADASNKDRHAMIEDLGVTIEHEKRKVSHLNSMLDGYRLAIRDVHHKEDTP